VVEAADTEATGADGHPEATRAFMEAVPATEAADTKAGDSGLTDVETVSR
jgi:hypothetical protein